MPKNAVAEWDTTAGNNSDVGGINIAEGMSPGNVNNAMREIMAQVAAWRSLVGQLGDNETVTGTWTFNTMPVIPDLGIATAKLANGAVTTAKLGDAQVTTAKLADGAATTVKIGDAQVTTAKLADNAVTTAKIGNAQVTFAKTTGVAPIPTGSNWVTLFSNVNVALALPAGGQWAYKVTVYNPQGEYAGSFTGVAAGGTTIVGATNQIKDGFAFQVS